MTETRSSTAAFTLIEVLVAASISAIVLAVAGLSLEAAVSCDRRSRREADEARKVLRLRMALSGDLKRLRMLEDDQPFWIQSGAVRGMRCDAVFFTRAGSLFSTGGDEARNQSASVAPRRVVYACESEGQWLTLLRVETLPYSTRGVAVPVLRDISHFSVEGVEEEDTSCLDGAERVVAPVLRVQLAFGGGEPHTFFCAPHATHRLRVPDASAE